MALSPRDQRDQIFAEEAKKKREKEWEDAAERVGEKAFEDARKSMIEKFGGAINPTIEDVLKYMQTRG